MHFQYIVAPPSTALPIPPAAEQVDGNAELLRELISVQREQLSYVRASYEAQNNQSRWQAFLSRWSQEFPDVGTACQKSLPIVERAFAKMLDEITSHLADEEGEGIDNEFALAEFLDRYGMRVNQLGTLLNVIGPIADAAKNISTEQ